MIRVVRKPMTKIVSLATVLLPLVSAVALAFDRHDNDGSSAKSAVRANAQQERRPGPLVIVGGGGTPDSVGRHFVKLSGGCLLYTSPSPRDGLLSRMPSSA